MVVAEAKPSIAELLADPRLVVRPQIEDEQPAARLEHACRLFERARRLRGVMQRLRQQRHVHRAVFDRQFFQFAFFPGDVRQPLPVRERLGARQYTGRSIDRGHLLCPPRRFHRQVAFTAAEIRDFERRQQQAERARPRRPASSRHELAAIARVGPHVLEVLSPQPQHFLQPRFIRLDERRIRRRVELRLQQRPQRALAVILHAGGQAIKAVGAVALLDDQPGFLEEPEVPRHARLRQPQDAGELLDVEAVLVEHPQQPQPGLVPEQTVQRGRRFHIYQSRLVD